MSTINSANVQVGQSGTANNNITLSTSVSGDLVINKGVFPALTEISRITNAGMTSAEKVSYLAAGVGAVATTLQVKLNDVVSVKDFGAIGDGSDESAKIQAGVNELIARGGGTLLLDPSKTYKVGSAITVGLTVSGVKACIDGQGGATVEALTAFTGGVFIVGSASQVRNLWGKGANLETAGHCFIYCGTPTYTNVSPIVDNVRNVGGFYDFVSSDYELDNAKIDVVSYFPVGRSVVYSGANAYAPSAGLSVSVTCRGRTADPVVGSPRTTAVYIAQAEDSRIKLVCSYFDRSYYLGASCRNVKVDESLCLEFRSALFATKWAALTAYTAGQFRAPTLARSNGRFYLCTTSGTSGAAEPTWPEAFNATVADGTVVWTEIGMSVAGDHVTAKSTTIQSSRFEDFNVCLLGEGDHTTSIHDSRLVGNCSYAAYTNGTASAMVATNSILSGDLRINSTIPASGGNTQFTGINNSVSNDTSLVVPNHARSFYSSQPVAGTGVKFPATAVASADVNTLDDYEEGSAALTVVSSSNYTTVSFVDGTYVKVGKLVTLSGQFTGTVTAATTLTWVQFESLPFNQAANTSRAIGTSSLSGNQYAAGTVIDASGSNATRFIAGMPGASVVGTGVQTMTFTITYEAA